MTEWEPQTSIYVVGYSRLGQRVATVLEQAYDWTYTEYEDDGVTQLSSEPETLDTLPHAIDRMRNRGVIAFAICPWQDAPSFLNRLEAALAQGTMEH